MASQYISVLNASRFPLKWKGILRAGTEELLRKETTSQKLRTREAILDSVSTLPKVELLAHTSSKTTCTSSAAGLEFWLQPGLPKVCVRENIYIYTGSQLPDLVYIPWRAYLLQVAFSWCSLSKFHSFPLLNYTSYFFFLCIRSGLALSKQWNRTEIISNASIRHSRHCSCSEPTPHPLGKEPTDSMGNKRYQKSYLRNILWSLW